MLDEAIRDASLDVRMKHDQLGEREVPGDAYWGIHTLRALENLRKAFAAKAREFASMLKMGRTQLQDAVPMALDILSKTASPT